MKKFAIALFLKLSADKQVVQIIPRSIGSTLSDRLAVISESLNTRMDLCYSRTNKLLV